tara:strand:+ start:309 stop:1001 length:693 start_codon:yes stop_codon:yes gene_type:complete
MERYSVLLISGIVVISLGLIFLLVFSSTPVSSPDICEVIIENDGENKVDIVFLTDQVSKNKVDDYVEYFLDSEPFSLNKEKINFYYAGETECEIKQGLLYCYSRDLLKKAGACKNDYIIVLGEEPRKIRSSAYINVVSVNIKHPKTVLLHEFAHVFSVLADEYVPSVVPRGSKNCKQECEDFEVSEGCFSGCSKSELSRSSESSVMRTLSTKDYKKLNTLLIERSLDKYE